MRSFGPLLFLLTSALISCGPDDSSPEAASTAPAPKAEAPASPTSTAGELSSRTARDVPVDYGYGTIDLSGSVIRGQVDRYTLALKTGDQLEVYIASEEDNASFTVIGPDGGTLPGTEESQDTRQWMLGSAGEGTYGIYVGPTRGNATYSLTVRTVAGAGGASSDLAVEGDLILRLEADGSRRELGKLARSDAFTGFGPTYALSPDGRAIAYIGAADDGYSLYAARDEDAPRRVVAEGQPDYRSAPVWAPDSTRFAFAQNDLVWIYDLGTRAVGVVAQPEKGIGEAVDPSFTEDGNRLYFYSGDRFEYSFRGDRYSVLLDGSDMRSEPEETPKYPGENLRGPEGE